MNHSSIEYSKAYDSCLTSIADQLQELLEKYLSNNERIDRISCRAKSIESFAEKSKNVDKNGNRKYIDPFSQIHDVIGARLIVKYLSDIEIIENIVKKYFKSIEESAKTPESEWEFGYFGKHLVFFLPSDVFEEDSYDCIVPAFFELQIKTMFQHAWSEANHDLGYKRDSPPQTPDFHRLLALASAQAWGADRIFDTLKKEDS